MTIAVVATLAIVVVAGVMIWKYRQDTLIQTNLDIAIISMKAWCLTIIPGASEYYCENEAMVMVYNNQDATLACLDESGADTFAMMGCLRDSGVLIDDWLPYVEEVRPTQQPAVAPATQQQAPAPTQKPETNPFGSCSWTCNDFGSCNSVKEYLSWCPSDRSSFDRDGDGVPCESVCK